MRVGVASRKQRRRAESEARQRNVTAIIAQVAPRLAAGEPNAGLSETELNSVLSQLQRDEKLASERQNRRTLDGLLRKLQAQSKGNVALPPPLLTIQRKPSPFRPKSFRLVPALTEVIDAFLKDLSNSREVSNQIVAARIIFSAIVFGGLLNRRLITAFPSALGSGLQSHNGMCWMEIAMKAKEDDLAPIRRWFPDPIAASLCAQWHLKKLIWPSGTVGEPRALIWNLFVHLGVRSWGLRFGKEHPFDLLLDAANARLRMHLPGLLVDFLQSSSHGTSLPARAWWRLQADYHLDSPVIESPESEATPDGTKKIEPPSTATPNEFGQDLGYMAGLKRCLKRKEKGQEHKFVKNAAALKALDSFRSKLVAPGAMFSALLDWCEWRLSKPGLRPSSLYRYLNSFAMKLIAHAGEIDPEKCAPTRLEAAYRQVLTAVATDEYANAVDRLRNFHYFLMLTREVDPVEIAGAITRRNVRANIVSEHEYQRALALIDRMFAGQTDARQRRMSRAILIVGYRLGPRKISELAHLRIRDLQDGGNVFSRRPLLWIHAHPDAALKTHDSLRRLPLAHLLSKDEREELFEWVRFRELECGRAKAAQSLVFCHSGQNTEPLVDRDFDHVVDILRHVCGDETVVFHTLRHSFLCNLFARLFIAELNSQFDCKFKCPWLLEDEDGSALLKSFFWGGVLPREAAYLLSSLAGHIDPQETMRSYVHLQDWITSLFLRELGAGHRSSVWAALEGISTDALYVRHSRNKGRKKKDVIAHLDTPQRLIAALKIKLPAGKLASALPTTLPPLTEKFSTLKHVPVEGAYNMLALAAQRMTPRAREYLTGVDQKTYQRMVNVATSLAEVPSATRNKTARRSRMLFPQGKRKRPDLLRIPQLDGFAPAIPRPSYERADARRTFRFARDEKKDVKSKDLWFLLRRTSHSEPIILVHALSDAARSIALLGKLGVPSHRLRLKVLSRPRAVENAQDWRIWLRTVSKESGIALRAIETVGNPMMLPISIKKYRQGRMAIQVIAETARGSSNNEQASDNVAGTMLSYGWRVGCYYALCIARALESPLPSTSISKTYK